MLFRSIAVPDQELTDENFTTCKSPNPEKLSAFNEAFRVLDRKKGDIIIATDPDADRVGAALIHNGTKIALTNNQIAVLMLDFLCEMKEHGKNAVIYRSVVSTPMADIIAAKHGIGVKTTLRLVSSRCFRIIQKHRTLCKKSIHIKP